MNPVYFLDSISINEVNDFLEGAIMRERESWEQTRLLSFIISKVGGCDAETVEEFIPFSWDDKKDEDCGSIDLAELRELREKAKKIERDLKHG